MKRLQRTQFNMIESTDGEYVLLEDAQAAIKEKDADIGRLIKDAEGLKAEIAELKRDVRRLEWLARQFRTCTVYISGQQPWSPSGYKLRGLIGRTFRDAIDAAIEKDKPC